MHIIAGDVESAAKPPMKRICVSDLDQQGNWPTFRQTPGRSGRWGDVQVVRYEEGVECDGWVVYDGLPGRQRVHCPPGNLLFITGEPPQVRSYLAKFVAQFPTVISCHRNLIHPNVIYQQQALGWWTGISPATHANVKRTANFDYDDFSTMPPPTKTKLLSVICSNKTLTPDQRARLAFVELLSRELGDQIDVWGNCPGYRPIHDKWDAIAPYRYHIALENSRNADYWTEKLADAYLGGAFPLYHGCPNLADYFPAESFKALDVNKPDESLRIVRDVIHNDTFSRSTEALAAAKSLVLNKYNLFAVIADWANSLPSGNKRRVELRPDSAFLAGPFRARLGRMKRWLLRKLRPEKATA